MLEELVTLQLVTTSIDQHQQRRDEVLKAKSEQSYRVISGGQEEKIKC